MCVRACVRACVRVCVCLCVCLCVRGHVAILLGARGMADYETFACMSGTMMPTMCQILVVTQ